MALFPTPLIRHVPSHCTGYFPLRSDPRRKFLRPDNEVSQVDVRCFLPWIRLMALKSRSVESYPVLRMALSEKRMADELVGTR